MSRPFRFSGRHFAAGLLATTALAGFAAPAHAQTNDTFTGAQSIDWYDGANWSANQPPAAADSAGIPDTTAAIDGGQVDIRAAPIADNGSAYLRMFNAAQVQIGTLILGGSNGTGHLSITSGAMLTSAHTTIGSNLFGAAGRVTMSGAGSFWSAGSFNIDNGFLDIGDHAELVTGGAGTEDDINGPNSGITLTGGASWISHAGLTVVGDDYVNAQGGYTPSNATLEVDGGSSASLQNLVLGLHGGTGVLTSFGGTTSVSGGLTVGGAIPYEAQGNGQINLSQGATLTSGSGDSAAEVGGNGGIGKAMLTDAGTSWTQNGTLGIGIEGGNGDVELSKRASLSSGALTIGSGDHGSGLFSLDNASAVTATTMIGTAGGSGIARLTSGADWNVQGVLDVGGGITVNADGNFVPLPAGTGQISLKGGSSLTAGRTAIGAGSGAQGVMSLIGVDDAGNGTIFTSSGVTFVGAFGGTGGVSADDGAAFNSSQLIVGYDAGTGSLSSDGGAIAITRDATIGAYSYQDGPTSGTLLLSNRALFTAGDYVHVGEQGHGVVSADGNATLETGAATFGLSGGTADVSLTNQSQWLVHGGLQIGGQLDDNGISSGFASVAIADSKLVSDDADATSFIGAGPGSTADLSLTGNDAQLTTAGDLFVGYSGASATVTVSQGAGFATGGTLYLGADTAAFNPVGAPTRALLTLDGGIGGASLTAIGVLSGDADSQASLVLKNGARWTTEALGIGFQGHGSVSATQSRIDVAGALQVGSLGGAGSLSLAGSQIDLGAGDVAIGCTVTCQQDGPNGGGVGAVHVEGGSSFITQGDMRVGGSGAAGTSGLFEVIDAGSRATIGGDVTVSDGGAIDLNLGATADFSAPQKVTLVAEGGSLDVASGAQLDVHGALGIDGAAHVTASNTVVDQALVASGGTLAIDGGSDVSADYVAIYGGDAGGGIVTVSGQGSRLTSAGAIDLGSFDYQGSAGGSGTGQLILGAGTEIKALSINIGTGAGAGILTVHAKPYQNLNTVTASVGLFNLGADGTYQVGIDTASASAGVVVSAGDATLADGGTIDVFKEAGGQYQLGDRYAILLTDLGRIKLGDVKLTGDTRRSLFVGLVPEVTLSPVSDFGEALYLDVEQDKSFASVAETPNQIAAATGADSLADANALKAAMLDIQTEDEARHSYDLLSGEIHASVRSGLYDDARLPREAVLERLSDGSGGNGAGLWMQALGDWGTIGSDRNAAALDRSAWGMLGGLDAGLGGATIGVAGGYTDTTLKADVRASRATVKSWHVLGYAGASLGAVRLRGGVGYAHADIDTQRSVAFTGYSDTPDAGYHGSTIQGFGEIGYTLPLRGATIEPFAGVSAVRSHTDALHETGGAAALSVAATHDTVTASTLGLHVATTSPGPLFAAATLGWQHRFGDRTPVSTMRFDGGDAFDIAGAPVSTDAATASLAAGWRITPTTTLTARYSGQIGGGSDASAVKLTLGIRF